MVDFGISSDKACKLVARLTPREAEIAEQVAMGQMREGIADALSMSAKTVDIHLTSIREKLEIEETYGIGRIWFAALVA